MLRIAPDPDPIPVRASTDTDNDLLPVNHLVEPLLCAYSAGEPGLGQQCVFGYLPYHDDLFAGEPSPVCWPSHYYWQCCVKVRRVIQSPNAF